MGITIPKRLENHLRKEDKWHTCVTTLKGQVEKILSESPEFFPDYTVHGVGHINEVLTAADKLIVDASFRDDCDKDAESGILEPMDVAYLVCAILIHDLGMFLHQDGVRKLTTGEHSGRWIKRSGDAPWWKLWQEYTDRTKAFSRERMHRHFGKLMQISDSSVEKETMDDDDKRIIGEFLRQNHGRLAHEIAMYGLPGSVDIDLFHNTDLTQTERDLIGLLARSHTMAIRDTEQYLKDKFEDGSMPENTPVFFLMSVLRIADLLDAGDHRAPELLLEHQRIHVPISREEWQWNQRIIRSKCKWNLKQKSRHIYAEPTTSIEYVQLDKWLRWVQAELDLCWSILAEQYPDGYKLSIHRVTSRIYQPDVQKTMNEEFLTREVKVTADPEVTRLLIAPLYGNDPSYGVRELLQNAVDACQEREYKETEPGYKGLVTIRIDPWPDPETGENRGVFTIEDNGIGMNEDVILNHYLAAGSSYRSSEAWTQEYTVGGKSQVARTGKFGVGFLAAFLLGDSISVVTQHRNDALGYSFTYTNQSKPLNIVRVEREQDAGTTITIPLKKGVWEKLENARGYPWYNWYAFDDPEVRYFFDDQPVLYKGLTLSRDPIHNPNWFELRTNDFDAYLWNPNPPIGHGIQFYCNGIRIYGAHDEDEDDDFGINVPYPAVSILDTSAKLDIDLARAFLQTFPNEDNLLDQMLRYHIARLLLTQWNTEQDYSRNMASGFLLNTSDENSGVPFLLTPQGFLPKQDTVMCMMGIQTYLTLFYNADTPSTAFLNSRAFLPDGIPVCVFLLDRIITDSALLPEHNLHYTSMSAISVLVEYMLKPWKHFLLRHKLNIVQQCFDDGLTSVWIHKDMCDSLSLNDPEVSGLTKNNMNGVYKIAPGSPAADSINIDPDHYDPDQYPVIVQQFYSKLRSESGEARWAVTSRFARVLREVLTPAPKWNRNDLWIPYDMNKRREKFPKAFRELKPYLDAIKKDPKAHHVNL